MRETDVAMFYGCSGERIILCQIVDVSSHRSSYCVSELLACQKELLNEMPRSLKRSMYSNG